MTWRLPIELPVASSISEQTGRSDRSDSQSVTGKSTSLPAHRSRGGRAGHRQVELVRASLSARDLAVLTSVSEHRFITTQQVEALHFAGHASPLSGARTARRVLRRLNDMGVLAHLDRRVGGVRAGSSGFVWTVGPIGWRLQDDRGSTRWRRYEPSVRLLAHYLAIAEVHVSLAESSRLGLLELLSLQLEPKSWRSFLGLAGDKRLLRPDLAVVTSTGEYEDHWFLEVDLGTEHPPTVIEKCRLYLDYADSGLEQRRSDVFPRVIWIVDSQQRCEQLQEAISRARLDEHLFRVVLSNELLDVLHGGAA